MTTNRGASPAEWQHFAHTLQLQADMLPCVPAGADVKVLPGSALEGKVGKIPSMFNEQGYAHGLKQWQAREIEPEEFAEWSKDDRYNICIRCGRSGVYALDVDVADNTASEAIAATIDEWFPAAEPIEWRVRANTGKFLVPFRMEGTWKKRTIETAHGVIELLGSGQQFVAAGTHSSGSRYAWSGGLPAKLPVLTEAQATQLWSVLTTKYATPGSTTSSTSTADDRTDLSSEDAQLRTSISDEDWKHLYDALETLKPLAADNDRWSEIGYALLSLKDSRPYVRDFWLVFSRGAPNYQAGAPESWWDTHQGQIPRSDYRHIFTLAREAGWRLSLAPDAFSDPEAGDALEVPGIPGNPSESNNELELPEPIGPERPIFRIEGGNLPHLIDKAEQTLAPHIYTRGGRLVELRHDDLRGYKVEAVTPAWITQELTRLGRWEKYDGRQHEWVACDCPDTFGYRFATMGNWPNISILDAVASAPFIRDDGSICEQPGYDARSRTLYKPSDTFPAIPVNPSRDDARAALERLMHPFSQFPFVSDVARAAFIAHILTEAARLSIDRVPMFWYSAPAYGIGKSLIADMPALIVHGKAPVPRSWPNTGDEVRKSLFAYLLQDERSIFFDNVPRGAKIRTAEMCAILTSDTWSDRKLGVSEGIAVRNRAVLSASGFNVTPSADMARRSIVIRLVTYETGRTFEIADLRKYVRAHRPELLVDALTILRSRQAHANVASLNPIASFEQWSRAVRDTLIWLGLPDPVSSQMTETDDEAANPSQAFEVLGSMQEGRPFTASEVAQLAGSHDKLNTALLDSGCDEPYSARKVGFWLRDYRDCMVGGWKLEQRPASHGYARWSLTKQTNMDLL